MHHLTMNSDLLIKQGVEDASWSYAYLVTAPRFLGYSFNPVSTIGTTLSKR
jgi:hypothetical protein